MSRVPYTIDVDEYVCNELEKIREMKQHLDFSSLIATVERIQHHVSSMENALYKQKDKLKKYESILKDGTLSDKTKLKRLKELK